VLRAIMDISARAASLTAGLNGPSGSPVYARARKTEPPSRLILSQTSAGDCRRHQRVQLPYGAKPRHVRACPGNGLGFYYAWLVISSRR